MQLEQLDRRAYRDEYPFSERLADRFQIIAHRPFQSAFLLPHSYQNSAKIESY
jgi:hypothetical protein